MPRKKQPGNEDRQPALLPDSPDSLATARDTPASRPPPRRRIRSPKMEGPQESKREESEQSNANREALCKTIQEGWLLNRVPLFLFGAYGTPIIIDEYFHGKLAIEKYDEERKRKGEEDRLYEGTGANEIDGHKVRPRPLQARFFGDLQTCNDGLAWRHFCRGFLAEWLVRFVQSLMVETEHDIEDGKEKSKAYNIYDRISQYISTGSVGNDGSALAFVLTTNFDGAIPEYVKDRNVRNAKHNRDAGEEIPGTVDSCCLVLSDPASMRKIPILGMAPPASQGEKGKSKRIRNVHKSWIASLRGDVYHAECKNKLCSVGDRRVSVYEALSMSIDKTSEADISGIGSQLTDVGWERADFRLEIFSDQDRRREAKQEKLPIDVWTKSSDGGDEEKLEIKIDSSMLLSLHNTVNSIMRCPECGGERVITISFPGLEKKEREIADMMSSIWSSIGSRISAICTVGFSGNSDREVVRHLAHFAQKVDCKWFDWGIAKDPSDEQPRGLAGSGRSRTAVCEIARRYLGNDGFLEILSENGAEDLTAHLPDPSETSVEMGSPYSGKKSPDGELMADMLWSEGESVSRRLHLSGTGSSVERDEGFVSIRNSFPSEMRNLYLSLSKPNAQMADLLDTSQLALKDYWWNPVVNSQPDHDPSLHSRMHHSLGFMRIADVWFRRLTGHYPGDSDSANTSATGTDDDEGRDPDVDALPCVVPRAYERILLESALCHDVGHSPFSHLLEEVFCELHWSLDGRSSFSHEDLTKIRISSMIRHRKLGGNRIRRYVELLDGMTGCHWIDAIMNSPLDADKIDYIFRDQKWLGIGGRQTDSFIWLSGFLSDQRVSPEGHIFLDRLSAVSAYRLLAERCHLYDTLYFSPKVRVMERMVQCILVTFFTLKVSDWVTGSVTKYIARDRTGAESSRELGAGIVKKVFGLDGRGAATGEKGEGVDGDEAERRKTRASLFLEDFFDQAIDPPEPEGILEEEGELPGHKQTREGPRSRPGDGRGRINDLGPVKLAYCIAELWSIIDERFPLVSAFRRQLRISSRGKEGREAKGKAHPLEAFLQRSPEVPVVEVNLVAEIGLWALGEQRKAAAAGGGEGGNAGSESGALHGSVADMCALVLDPSCGHEPPLGDSAVANGLWLDWVLGTHCIGGPYVLRAPDHFGNVHLAEDWLDHMKAELVEIGRQLAQEYPGRVLLDVTGPLKVRSYPRRRVMPGADGNPVVSEQFWVPAGDPESWSVASVATIPLSDVDFRKSIPQAYKLRVLLVDPRRVRKDGRSLVVDRFRRVCRARGIPLEDKSNDVV